MPSGAGAEVSRWGVAKLVKAPDFDSGIRGFESFLPSHLNAIAGSRARSAVPGNLVPNPARRDRLAQRGLAAGVEEASGTASAEPGK
jgi:hypothetical protein